MNRFKIVSCSAWLVLLAYGCLPDDKLKIGLNMEPEPLDDGWEISSPGEEGFDEVALHEAYSLFFSETDYVTGISLLVVRNGKLVAEGYSRDMEDRQTKRNLQSATKSFTSLAFGIAMDEGYFSDLDQGLYDFVPDEFDSDPTKREITLRHLLTMRAGLRFDNEAFAQELHIDARRNHIKHILAKPLYADPGSEYWYRDCDPQLLGGAIQNQAGKTLEEIVDEHLFGPMGITDYTWEMNADGYNWAAQALYMKPRDMAKIGLLVSNRGNWEGQQLVPEQWIEQSTSFQTEFVVPGRDLSSVILPDIGFYWWIYEPDFPKLPDVRAIAAEGSGGQYIFLVPDKDLIIVMTSEPYTAAGVAPSSAFFPLAEMIINSIVD